MCLALPSPKPRSRWAFWLKLSLSLSLASLVLLAGAALLVVSHYSKGLPSVERLKSGYDPPQVSRIYAREGTLLSSLFTERRTVVAFEQIPKATKLAFLAAEDAHFYEHDGFNYLGVLRALWVNLRAGRTRQGGSTITQQVVRNTLLDLERTYRRKVRESILTHRLEQQLSKDEIFNLYLNHIYLGHGRYGVEEAARYYFGRHAKGLTAGQSALLAGLVASPERYSPRRAPDKAHQRRRFVLSQMREKGFISVPLFEQLLDAPEALVEPGDDTRSGLAPEIVKVATNRLSAMRKEQRNRVGYRLTTTLDPAAQLKAREAVRRAISAYEKRHGLHPPYRARQIKSWGKPFKGRPRPNRIYVGRVTAVDDDAGTLAVQVGQIEGVIKLSSEARYNPEHLPPSGFAEVGAVLRVRLVEPAPEGPPRLALELGPQGALAAIDVRSRDVVALVGSYEGTPGGLDRARQMRRQPGSSFKPFVFSYALHTRQATPATVLQLRREGRGVQEEPPFSISVRSALAHSNNEAAEILLAAVGPQEVVDWAHRLGIRSKLGTGLSLALGAYEVGVLELANAFTTFASGGFLQRPRFVLEVRGADGSPLPQTQTSSERVMPAEEAYLVTSMLRSAVEFGTGRRAQRVGHPVAAKSGTTNGVRDAWFVGYTTELVCAVWVGFDDGQPLGTYESGSKTAAPAFVDFMTAMHANRPVTDFPRPPGILELAVDPVSGLLPWPGQVDTRREEFLDDSAPETWVPRPYDPSEGHGMPSGATQ